MSLFAQRCIKKKLEILNDRTSSRARIHRHTSLRGINNEFINIIIKVHVKPVPRSSSNTAAELKPGDADTYTRQVFIRKRARDLAPHLTQSINFHLHQSSECKISANHPPKRRNREREREMGADLLMKGDREDHRREKRGESGYL